MCMKNYLLLFAMSSFALTSCVDGDYDLGNVNTDDATLGTSWSAPLGVGNVTSEDVIDVENVTAIKTDANGAYYAIYEGLLEEPAKTRSVDLLKAGEDKKLVALVDVSTEELHNLFDGDFVLALENPHIKIKSGITDAVLNCRLVMTSYGMNKNFTTYSDFPLTLSEPNVWIGPIIPEQQENYKFVENKETPMLLQVVPNNIHLDLYVDNDQAGTVPSETYAQMSYCVELPFVPTKEFKATSTELIENAFDENFVDYIFSDGSAEIYGQIKNEMPFDLNVKMQILDENKNLLDIDLPAQEVKGNEGNVVFKITKDDMPKMENARHINLQFDLIGRDNNEALKKGQKVEMILKLKKEGGISI